MLYAHYVRFHIFIWIWVSELLPIGKIAAHSAYIVFS